MTVRSLLSGPRGRYLVAAVACRCADVVRHALFHAADDPRDERALRALVRALSAVDLDLVSSLSIAQVYEALAESVAQARYWQEPIGEDRLLASPALDGVLGPIGERILGHQAAADWASDIVESRQRYVQWAGAPPPRLVGARRSLAEWHSDVVEEEARALRERPADPRANVSGTWWSSPPRVLVSTSPGYEWLGATDLILTEDEQGWSQASIWPMKPTGPVRVFEIASAADWVQLVGSAPMNVSRSRLHDWYRATGRAGDWFIPDWLRVSDRYDAIHLKVAGYLEAAGRCLPAGSGGTVLAGWNPGATYWLSDCLVAAEPPSPWELRLSERGERRWQAAT